MYSARGSGFIRASAFVVLSRSQFEFFNLERWHATLVKCLPADPRFLRNSVNVGLNQLYKVACKNILYISTAINQVQINLTWLSFVCVCACVRAYVCACVRTYVRACVRVC